MNFRLNANMSVSQSCDMDAIKSNIKLQQPSMTFSGFRPTTFLSPEIHYFIKNPEHPEATLLTFAFPWSKTFLIISLAKILSFAYQRIKVFFHIKSSLFVNFYKYSNWQTCAQLKLCAINYWKSIRKSFFFDIMHNILSRFTSSLKRRACNVSEC